MTKPESPAQKIAARLEVISTFSKHCHAAKDGDCIWKKCPQNKPSMRMSHCPIDFSDVLDEEI